MLPSEGFMLYQFEKIGETVAFILNISTAPVNHFSRLFNYSNSLLINYELIC